MRVALADRWSDTVCGGLDARDMRTNQSSEGTPASFSYHAN
jgi:hypothetical protein